MKTKKKTGLLAICVFFVVCLSAMCLSTSQHGGEKRYEVRPEITLPESQTDVSRVIDAYERLINNYIKPTEDSLINIRSEVRDVSQRLDSIEDKISELSAQLERIEKKLGIEQPPKAFDKPLDAETPLSPEEQNTEKPQQQN